MTDADLQALADKHGFRYRAPDDEGMTFDKHAVIDMLRELAEQCAKTAEMVAKTFLARSEGEGSRYWQEVDENCAQGANAAAKAIREGLSQ